MLPYTIGYPNRFIDDSYGQGDIFRVSRLVWLCSLLLIGLLITLIGWKKKVKTFIKVGLMHADLCSMMLIVLAFNVYDSRAEEERRKTYLHKNTTELIRIAAEQNDH